MNTDTFYIFSWWFLLLIVGLSSIPISFLLFRKFVDLGYGFAKTVGLLFITYLAFIGGVFRVIPFSSDWLFWILAAYVGLNIVVLLQKRREVFAAISEKIRVLVAQEALFSAGYLFWALVRGFQPDIRGLEKFMDYGFINSILRSSFFPPLDMWLSGESINYYWFGHLVVGVTTRLSSIPQGVAYNLMLATILGLALTAAFSISATLIKNVNSKLAKRTVYAAGIISALLLVFAGNFHTPIYVLKEGVKNYWYPDATRFIGYNPETEDKTIHEFPQYSFVVSDLHAHLLNFPMVLLFLALLLSTLYKTASDKGNSTFNFSKLFIPLGFTLGIMFMTNAWDFANYLLVAGVTFGLFNLVNKDSVYRAVLNSAISLVLVAAIALVVALPFIVNFESIAQGIAFVKNHTPVWQLGVLWGFPALLTAIYLFLLYKTRVQLKTSDIFIVSLLATSWILIVLPELIYVKDIYIASHHRANTMFKLTYQAFVMFYLSSGYIAIRTLTSLNNTLGKRLLTLFYGLLFTSVLSYSFFAVNSYYGGLKNYRGLLGETWLKELYPSEYGAILWFRKNVRNQPVILEAPGDSYTDYNVISSYTGLPTASGWFVHEWLWRGSPDISQKRVADIAEIYTSRDIEKTTLLLKKYDINYVVISTFEREKYANLYEPKFKVLGKPTYSRGATTIYQVKN